MDDTIEKSDDLLTNKCLDQQIDQDLDQELGQTHVQSGRDGTADVDQEMKPSVDPQSVPIDWNFPEDNQPDSQPMEAPGARSGLSREPVLSYHLKWINWMSAKTPIVTQNLNGPCPLLAIINVLILKRKIQLPPMMDVITDDQLMEYLGDCILSSVPKNIPEGVQLNYEQNFMDAMQILPKLPKGLDVNVRFTGVSDFEYTPECIVFDLLHIPLYHGWLVDPNDAQARTAVGNCSYNQLVDRIINNKTSTDPELVTEALIAEEYLEKTASQLTNYGLQELVNHLKEQELCVLFRNNHFIVLFKNKNQLYQLVTDQGFLIESNVVWETLNNIEGDTQFVDGEFVVVPPKPSLTTAAISQQQIDQDYLVALSLQEEQKRQMESCKEWEQFKHDAGMEDLTDEELAKRLQEEEDKRYAAQRQRNEQQQQLLPQSPPQPHLRGGQQVHPNSQNIGPQQRRGTNGSSEDSENGSNKSKSKNCCIV